MTRSIYRTGLISAAVIIALIHVYPTIGWMTLSEDQQLAHRIQWDQEDLDRQEPNLFRDSWRAVKRWSEFDRDSVINLGLDLQGGIHMVLGLDVDSNWDDLRARFPESWSREDIIKEVQDETLNRIKRRINEFEAKEPLVQALGDSQIQVQLPGEKDKDRAIEIITRVAYLEFYLLAGEDKTQRTLGAIDDHSGNNFVRRLQLSGIGVGAQPYFVPMEEVDLIREMIGKAETAGDVIPEDAKIALGPAPKPWDKKQRYELYVLDAPAAMPGSGLQQALARPDNEQGQGRWMIYFDLDADSGKKFGEITGANINRRLATVVDDVVESAPNIIGQIFSSGSITGQFDMYEARDLAIALNSGSMDVRITEDSTGVVGPGLGEDSIRKGIYSAALGLALVMIFMVYYYRVAGLIANVALLFNALLVVAALAYFNATLTLPGIAGMILTIGMAVDANVLIFERIREEIRNGKSLLASIDSGFSKATVTILDANVTTLIAAVVLLEFGTGPIEGFAVTLSIGVCSSVFTALVVSRAFFDLLTDRGWMAKLSMVAFVGGETRYKFLERRRFAFAFSALVIIAGVAMFGVRGEDNFGVDFRTGTNMIVNLESNEKIPEQAVRSALVSAGFDDPSVVAYEQTGADKQNQMLIRVSRETTEPAPGTNGEDSQASENKPGFVPVSTRVESALQALCDKVDTEKIDTVGPAVGNQLKWDAFKSISVALLFIIAYLWFRFELKFAAGAVVALLHDILVTVGIFAMFGRQLSLPVVAALLTIIGYSLNDTIVVFDRVREDLRLYRGRGMTFLEVLNLSINHTLSRTLLTSMTTLFVVVILAIFGGAMIRDFALALTVGVIVGTYSSIFVASPVVYFWQKIQGRHLLAIQGPSQSTRETKPLKLPEPVKEPAGLDAVGEDDTETSDMPSQQDISAQAQELSRKDIKKRRPGGKTRRRRKR